MQHQEIRHDNIPEGKKLSDCKLYILLRLLPDFNAGGWVFGERKPAMFDEQILTCSQ